MVKRVSQTLVKISKNEKELNSLISLKKPKVYITDCLSFKSLVQNLTGNGRISYNVSVTTSSSLPRKQHHTIPVVDVEEHQVQESERSTTTSSSVNVSAAASFDAASFDAASFDAASFDSSQLWNQEMFMNDQELDQLCYQMYDTTANILEGSSPSSTADQMVDMLPFEDLESWLLGSESFELSNFNSCGLVDQQVSIFDNVLSGLI